MNKHACLGPKNDNVLLGERCFEKASYMTPQGPRCEKCAQREMKNIRDGACMLAMLADAQGVPRETLLKKYVRIQ